MGKSNIKNDRKGITLVALVVTIVVLLILSGITITVLSDDNGIIGQAQNAKYETENKVNEELNWLNSIANKMNEIIDGTEETVDDGKISITITGGENCSEEDAGPFIIRVEEGLTWATFAGKVQNSEGYNANDYSPAMRNILSMQPGMLSSTVCFWNFSHYLQYENSEPVYWNDPIEDGQAYIIY